MDIKLKTKYDIGDTVITCVDNRLFICRIEGIEIRKSISIEQHGQDVAYKVKPVKTNRFFLKPEEELFTKEEVYDWLSSLTSKDGE